MAELQPFDVAVEPESKDGRRPGVGAVPASTWSTGGTYLHHKSQIAYDKLNQSGTYQVPIPGLSYPTTGPDVCINNTDTINRGYPVKNAYRGGAEWLYTNSCASQVMSANDATAHIWGNPGAADKDKVTACTDGKHFAVPYTPSQLIHNYTFQYGNIAAVARASVLFHVGAPIESGTHTDSSVAELKHGLALYNSLYFGSRNGIVGSKYSAGMYTSDKNVTCQQMQCNVGAGGAPVAATQNGGTVTLRACQIPNQTLASCSTDCAKCDGVLDPDPCLCVYGAGNKCVTHTVDDTQLVADAGPLVYRDTDLYFTVMTGADGSVCEWADAGTQKCLFFNGTLQPSDGADQSYYLYEPSPFADPSACAGGASDPTCLQNKVYYVPVTFGLLNVSCRKSDVDLDCGDLTYLQRLLNCQCAGVDTPAGTCCETASASNGWTFFQQMYTDMVAVGPEGQDAAYDSFRLQYYGYVAVQLYFLGMYAYTMPMSRLPYSRYYMFMGDSEWAQSAAFFADGGGSSLQAQAVLNIFASDGKGLFSGARPVLGTITADNKVSVQLTVPSILFRTLLKTPGDFGTIQAAAVSQLLFRCFPESVGTDEAMGTGFHPQTYFSNDGRDSAADVTNPGGADIKQPFTVTDLPDASDLEFFWFNDVPVSGPTGAWALNSGAFDAANPPANSPLLAVRFSCNVQLQVPTQPPVDNGTLCPDTFCGKASMSLLFYLKYLQTHAKGTGIENVCDAMFMDQMAARINFMQSPATVDWTAACVVLQHQLCRAQSDGTLTYDGDGSDAVNALFLSTASSTCLCLEGSNLPAVEKTHELNAASMCFNVQCNKPPVCLSSILNNMGDRTDCKDCVRDPASCTNEAYDCKQHCDEYLNVLKNYTAEIDLKTVDFDALQQLCGFDLRTLQHNPSLVSFWYAALGLTAAAAPFVYGVTALACWLASRRTKGTPFGESVALQPAFYGTMAGVAALLAGGVAYLLLDFKGQQVCRGSPNHNYTGFAYPSSKCQAQSKLLDAILGTDGYVVDLPQDLCVATPQSYCMHSAPDAADATGTGTGTGTGSDGAATFDCGSSSNQMCSVPGANGVCVAQENRPYEGRSLEVKTTSRPWNVLVVMLCTALALCAVPAVALACWYGAENLPFAGRVALTVVSSIAALCGCFAYLLVWYEDRAASKQLQVGIGACDTLANYPDRLVSMSTNVALPAGTAQLTYTAGTQTLHGGPVYETATRGDGIGRFLYISKDTQAFVVTDDVPDPTRTSGAASMYSNARQSAPLMHMDEDSRTVLYSDFTNGDGATFKYISFCGSLGPDSSCGTGPGCPCAGQVAADPLVCAPV
jgi:hypothetical protein